MKRIFILSLFFTQVLFAQNSIYRIKQLPVLENGIAKEYPFMGGLNIVNISQYDFNGDGFQDLFLFDNSSNKPFVLINEGVNGQSKYRYEYAYESIFPNDLNFWAVLKDYNCDNIPDLFTERQNDIRLYKGTKKNNALSFTWVTDTLRAEDTGVGKPNVQIVSCAVPTFEDVNGDGYLDILSVLFDGINARKSVTLLRNETGNLSLPCDQFKLKVKTNCWGKHVLNELPFSMKLSQCGGVSSDGIVGPYTKGGLRHCGSHSTWIFDEDNDGDYEVGHGFEFSDTTVYGRNGGNKNFGNMDSTHTAFPNYTTPIPYKLSQGFWMDVDNDGKKDLIATTQEKTDQLGSYINKKHISFYKNIPQGNVSKFMYQNNRFLEGNMIDAGFGSYPTLFDYNNDSLLDLIISNDEYYINDTNHFATLTLYKNTGTKTEPKFEWVTDDFANLQKLKKYRLVATFGDLDGDGKMDMVLGDKNGGLHYSKNKTQLGIATFDSVMINFIPTPKTLNPTAPHMYDIDEDGKLDLIFGNKDGKINYIRNIGSTTKFNFDTTGMNKFLGEIIVNDSSNEIYYNLNAVPSIAKNIDSTNNTYLFVANSQGKIARYIIDKNKLTSGRFIKKDSSFFSYSSGIGGSIGIGDINADGKSEFFIGNIRGGLTMYSLGIITNAVFDTLKYTPPSSIQNQTLNQNSIIIYPNPCDNYFSIQANQQIEWIEIYDIYGKMVKNIELLEKTPVDISQLVSGTYLVKAKGLHFESHSKLIKQ